jgi:predicted flap endonuclease-1-like 5' DNA nuclease
MSIFTGIATGFLGAAIKDKEAKDNLRMKIAESAGIDYYTKDKPDHDKKQKLFEKDFKNVAELYGTHVANYFGSKTGIFGDGKALNTVSNIMDKYNLDEESLKKMTFSTFEERQAGRESEFQSRGDQIKNLTGIGGIGPKAAELQLEGFGKTETTDVAPIETTDITQATDTEQKVSTDIGSLWSKKPEAVGVESKFNSISKAVNEQMGYGEAYYNAQDGTTRWNIANNLKKISNAHIAIASDITGKDKTINQIDAVSLAKQELDRQTYTPFQMIASALSQLPEFKNVKYTEGAGKQKALFVGAGPNIDATTTMIGNQSIYDFLTDVYINDLMRQDGNVSTVVLEKFAENIPENLMIKTKSGNEKLSNVILNSHRLHYFKKLR